MDHVLWRGLYADRVRTNWCFGSKDGRWCWTGLSSQFHSQGKCIEIHVGYEKETREINRCGDEWTWPPGEWLLPRLIYLTWRRWMSHLGNAIGYHGIVDKRHCRNNWWLPVPRSNVGPNQQQTKLKEWVTMRQREPKYISAFTTWYARQKWKKPWYLVPRYTSSMGMAPSQGLCTNFMAAYLVWKVQGILDKGCSWIGGPTGSGKTLVAAMAV